MNYVFGLESFALNDLAHPEYKKKSVISRLVNPNFTYFLLWNVKVEIEDYSGHSLCVCVCVCV